MANLNIHRHLALIATTVLLAQPAYAQTQNNPKIELEITRQQSIYHGRGEQRPAGYTIDRTLNAYGGALGPTFDRALANLGPQDRWLDIGAGRGQAVLDYFSLSYDKLHPEGRERRGKKASAVAMSIEDRRTEDWNRTAARLEPRQLQYLFNKRMDEYTAEELGRFQLISDVIGGFSYTDNLHQFMEKVLSVLSINSTFHTVLQDVRSEQGDNKPHYAGAPFLTEIRNASGTDVGVCAWLKQISCVEVSCMHKTTWVPPIETYQVRKTCDSVKVPRLETISYTAGTPPERIFRLSSPAQQAPAKP